MRGLDDVTEDVIDKVMQCQKEIFQNFLYDQNQKINYGHFRKLASIDPGFTYNFCVDKSNKITGFVWMTSVMRSNLYRIKSFISVDFRKKKTNVHLWPYILILLS